MKDDTTKSLNVAYKATISEAFLRLQSPLALQNRKFPPNGNS
jgi:hypothetical protein